MTHNHLTRRAALFSTLALACAGPLAARPLPQNSPASTVAPNKLPAAAALKKV